MAWRDPAAQGAASRPHDPSAHSSGWRASHPLPSPAVTVMCARSLPALRFCRGCSLQQGHPSLPGSPTSSYSPPQPERRQLHRGAPSPSGCADHLPHCPSARCGGSCSGVRLSSYVHVSVDLEPTGGALPISREAQQQGSLAWGSSEGGHQGPRCPVHSGRSTSSGHLHPARPSVRPSIRD